MRKGTTWVQGTGILIHANTCIWCSLPYLMYHSIKYSVGDVILSVVRKYVPGKDSVSILNDLFYN